VRDNDVEEEGALDVQQAELNEDQIDPNDEWD